MPRPAGYAPDEWVECETCAGTGVLYIENKTVVCNDCDGQGGWPASNLADGSEGGKNDDEGDYRKK